MKCFICLLIAIFIGLCAGFGQYHMRRYDSRQMDSSEEDLNNPVLRSFRRCMWDQSRFLPRRLMMLSLCSNLFCENNQIMSRSRSIFVVEKKSRPNDCLDILPDECEQGDEEDFMYKPFPECCPVYCNLKRRMQRLKGMHIRHRKLLNMQHQQAQTDLHLGNYNVDDLNFR